MSIRDELDMLSIRPLNLPLLKRLSNSLPPILAVRWNTNQNRAPRIKKLRTRIITILNTNTLALSPTQDHHNRDVTYSNIPNLHLLLLARLIQPLHIRMFEFLHRPLSQHTLHIRMRLDLVADHLEGQVLPDYTLERHVVGLFVFDVDVDDGTQTDAAPERLKRLPDGCVETLECANFKGGAAVDVSVRRVEAKPAAW